MTADSQAVAATIASGLSIAWAVVQHLRAGKAEKKAEIIAAEAASVSTSDLAKMNAELAASYKQKAEEWKQAFEVEHAESQKYRQYVHDKAQADTKANLVLVEENLRLQARTDLTPIISHIETQSKTNERVAETLMKLTTAVTELMDRISRTQIAEP